MSCFWGSDRWGAPTSGRRPSPQALSAALAPLALTLPPATGPGRCLPPPPGNQPGAPPGTPVALTPPLTSPDRNLPLPARDSQAQGSSRRWRKSHRSYGFVGARTRLGRSGGGGRRVGAAGQRLEEPGALCGDHTCLRVGRHGACVGDLTVRVPTMTRVTVRARPARAGELTSCDPAGTWGPALPQRQEPAGVSFSSRDSPEGDPPKPGTYL